MAQTESVHSLVNDLCRHHLKPNASSITANGLHLLKLKSHAYRILLHSQTVCEDHLLSTIERLSVSVYKLRHRGNYSDATRLEDLITTIAELSAEESGNVQQVLRFLMNLSDTTMKNPKKVIGDHNVTNRSRNRSHITDVLYPDHPPIYGEEFDKKNSYYMHFPKNIFEDVESLDSSKRNIKSMEIFELMPGFDEDGGQLSCARSQNICTPDDYNNDLFGGLHHPMPSKCNLNVKLQIPELNDFIDHRFDFKQLPRRTYKLSQTSEAISEDEGFLDLDNVQAYEEDIWETVATMKPNKYYTWETIGRKYVKKEKPLLSEAGSKVADKLHSLLTKNLLTLNPSLLAHLSDPILVKQSDLVADIINVFIGVPSVNFQKINNTFVLRPGVHVDGLTPDSTASLLSFTVTAANNYLKLSSLPAIHSTINHQGLMSQAFRSGIDQYLASYQATVLMLNHNVTLMELNAITSKLRDQIDFLTILCRLERDGQSLPYGVDLLSYIYKTAVEHWYSEHYALLLFLLRTTCRPYFKFLQDWLFEGKCEDIFGEYLIQADDFHLNTRDRLYWTRGYVLLQTSDEKSNVPIFLRNIGKDIFLCGKSLNLLKLCNPNHSLCRIDRSLTPDLTMTFSNSALESLNEKCQKYFARITFLTNQSTSTREQHLLMEEEDRRRQAAIAKEQAERAIARVTDQELQDRKRQYDKKKKELESLKTQMEEDIARRKKTKADEASKDALMAEKAELERLEIIQQEKKEMEMRQKKTLDVAETNLQQAKLRRRRSTSSEPDGPLHSFSKNELEVQAVITRMSITEDDDGMQNFNLNDIKANNSRSSLNSSVDDLNITTNVYDNTAVEKTIIQEKSENLNKVFNAETGIIGDDINSNLTLDQTRKDNQNYQINNNNEVGVQIAFVNEYNKIKDDGLLCESSMTISKLNSKSEFGHASDSSIQTLLYSDYQNRNVSGRTETPNVTKPCSKFRQKRQPNMNENNTQSTAAALDEDGNIIPAGVTTSESNSVGVEEVLKCSAEKAVIPLLNVEKSTVASNGTSCKEEGAQDKLDSGLLKFALNQVSNQDRVEKKTAQIDHFSYDKCFPEFDKLPNPDLINNKITVSNIVEDDKDIAASMQIPLSVLLERSLLKPVSTQVNLVNKNIAEYFMVDLQINEHFNALRNFLFLHDGEFGHMLSEQLFTKISSCSSPAEVLNPITLNNLLSRSLASSLHGDSAFTDNLSFLVKPSETTHSIVFSILNSLQLNYKITWPHNIIITEKDICRYNKVFIFIIQVKHSIWALNEVFFHLKRQALLRNLDHSPQFRQLQIYRHEMQHFSRVLQSYVVSQVLQITWQEFQQKLETDVHNIDDLRQAHSLYLNKACFRCLLNEKSAPVLKIIQDIFALIMKFRTHLVMHSWHDNPETGFAEHPKFNALTSSYKIFRGYAEFLCKVLRMLAERSYQTHFHEFLLWLDFNEHYHKKRLQ